MTDITRDNAYGQGWPTLHDAIAAPLSPSPVGDDPRYSDDFSDLKAEVQKRSDVDYEAIFALSCTILCNQAKDIRVAGYLVLAAGRLQGLYGFCEALRACNALLLAFGDNIHPTRETARLSAIRWIFQEKILTFTRDNTQAPDHELVTNALAEVDTFSAAAGTVTGEEMTWPELAKWLNQLEQSLRPKADDIADTTTSPAPKESPDTDTTPAPAAGNNGISSDAEHLQVVRQLLLYYREKQQYGALVGVSRSLKWGDLKLPPNDNGKTRLPPPRPASLNRIHSALENEQWQDAWLAAEDAFMEPSGQFSLDIQRLSHHAASKAGLKTAAAAIASQVQALVTRLPKLTQLKFDNDEPFMTGPTAGWLEQLQSAGNGSGNGDATTDLLGEARTIANEDGVTKGLNWLSEQANGGLLTTLHVQLAQAQLCIEQDKSQIARPLLAELCRQIEHHQINRLEPALALRVWRQQQFSLQDQLSEELSPDSKAAITAELNTLHSLICKTDITQAANWL